MAARVPSAGLIFRQTIFSRPSFIQAPVREGHMKSLVVFVSCATLAAGLASLPSSAVAQQKSPVAQDAVRAGLPDTTLCPESIAAIATCYTAKLETGASLFSAIPKNWNGNLIVFAHGGPSYTPPTATPLQRFVIASSVAVKRGFAWIASTYRREGFGVRMAAEDSDDARKFFVARIATPKRTILHGVSYGGVVGAKLVETYAKKDGSTNFD